jgi:hypothetical protein
VDGERLGLAREALEGREPGPEDSAQTGRGGDLGHRGVQPHDRSLDLDVESHELRHHNDERGRSGELALACGEAAENGEEPVQVSLQQALDRRKPQAGDAAVGDVDAAERAYRRLLLPAQLLRLRVPGGEPGDAVPDGRGVVRVIAGAAPTAPAASPRSVMQMTVAGSARGLIPGARPGPAGP